MGDWVEALAQASEVHRDLPVDRAALAAHAEIVRGRGGLVEHLPDLVLAFAAGRGDPTALRRFEQLTAADVRAAARRVDPSPAFADEVAQAVRVRLLVAEHDRVRLDDYGGRGPLRGWVGVVALRLALNLKRGKAPTTEDVLGELVSGEADPELRHLKTLYRAEFREALEAALLALPERQRAILRLSFVDGLKHVQLAKLYQVHETTASRWVAQAAADVAEGAKSRLISRLSLSPDSLDSVARMVLSHLDLSIARILSR
jgi:RNA polymerase sigma-70 factor, ECF subfamily